MKIPYACIVLSLALVESAVFHPGSYIIGNTCQDKLMRTKFIKRGGIPKSRGLLKKFTMYRVGLPGHNTISYSL